MASCKVVHLLLLLGALGLQATSVDRVTQVEGIECYHFTWVKDDNSTDCDALKLDDGIPCYQPIILTVPQSLPPDLDDLENQCSKKSCTNYSCREKDNECLRWVRYDISGAPTYITTFCGNMVDFTKEDKPNTVYSSSYRNRNGTVLTEVRTCGKTKCNNSSIVSIANTILGLSVGIVLVSKNYLIR